MAAARVHVDGKFFRLGGKKFYPRGLTYGPFAPNEQKEMFPSREQTVRDFLQLRELGAIHVGRRKVQPSREELRTNDRL